MTQFIKRAFFLLLIFSYLILKGTLVTAQPASIIIVIDDIGNDFALGQQAIDLPGPIHYAVLPHTFNGPRLAQLAHQQGKEVLLHAPMSTISGKLPGPGALTPQLNKQEFLTTLNNNLLNIPHVQGINNHMGSELTQMPQPMDWLMNVVKEQQLYFLDSRTSALTVAQKKAQFHNIPNLKRDVFLDNNRNTKAIHQQFEKLLAIADKNGFAVAIGHPYPETISVLKDILPTLTLRGYQQRFASEFLMQKNNHCQQLNAPFINTTCTLPITLSLSDNLLAK